MALFPKGDPRRAIQVATWSMWVLGIVFLLLGLLMALALGMSRPRGAEAVVEVIAVVIWLTPGVLYLVSAIFLGRRREWAVVLGLVLASVQGLGALALLVTSVAGVMPVGIVGGLIWEAALVQLIYHLAKSVEGVWGKSQV